MLRNGVPEFEEAGGMLIFGKRRACGGEALQQETPPRLARKTLRAGPTHEKIKQWLST